MTMYHKVLNYDAFSSVGKFLWETKLIKHTAIVVSFIFQIGLVDIFLLLEST